FFSSRRRHTRCYRDWSSDVCSSDLVLMQKIGPRGIFPRTSTMLNKKFSRLLPEPIVKNARVADLIEGSFKAYNGGRLAEGCRLRSEERRVGKEGGRRWRWERVEEKR